MNISQKNRKAILSGIVAQLHSLEVTREELEEIINEVGMQEQMFRQLFFKQKYRDLVPLLDEIAFF